PLAVCRAGCDCRRRLPAAQTRLAGGALLVLADCGAQTATHAVVDPGNPASRFFHRDSVCYSHAAGVPCARRGRPTYTASAHDPTARPTKWPSARVGDGAVPPIHRDQRAQLAFVVGTGLALGRDVSCGSNCHPATPDAASA